MPQVDVYTQPPSIPAGDDKLRVYSNPVCPYAERVRLVLAARGVDYEIIDINLKVKPDWFLDINPYGQVPVVEHKGKIIRESLIGFDYIDEVFPGDQLWPTDPYEKARAKVLLNDFGNQFTPNWYKFYFGKQTEETNSKLSKYLCELERELERNGEKYLQAGDKPGALDLLLWPWFERLESAKQVMSGVEEIVPEDKYPLLYKWMGRMNDVEAVKKASLPVDIHAAFYKNLLKGVSDYGVVDTTGKGIKIYTKKTE